jgi:hypothetical protein
VSSSTTLRGVLEAAADVLEDVEVHANGGATATQWSTKGIVFASLAGDRAEFRLARPVAAAALRTPDTAKSARGADWVAFAPAALDGHAIDRAEAWLASAWRRASGGD